MGRLGGLNTIRILVLMATSVYSAELRLVSHEKPDYPPLARQARAQGTVELLYSVGDDGHPNSIELVRGHPLLVPHATANLKSWRLTGTPPMDRMRVEFEYVLTGRPGDYRTNDPPVVEFDGVKKIRVSVENLTPFVRSGCPAGPVDPPAAPLGPRDGIDLASGPIRIKVFADGEVLQTKRRSPRFMRGKISKQRAQAIIDKFRTTQFWSLCSSYREEVEDGGTSTVSVTIAGYHKQVFDYAQASPAWLRQMTQETIAAISKKKH